MSVMGMGSGVARWLQRFRQGMLKAWTKATTDKSLLMVNSVGFVDIGVRRTSPTSLAIFNILKFLSFQRQFRVLFLSNFH